MFGGDYSEFIETATDPGQYYSTSSQSRNGYNNNNSSSNNYRHPDHNLYSPFNLHHHQHQRFDLISNHNHNNHNRISDSSEMMDVILAKNFVRKPYPVDFGLVNPFCPICGKFVQKTQPNQHLMFYSERMGKTFLGHEDCLMKEEANGMFSAFHEEHEEAKIEILETTSNPSNQHTHPPHKSIPIGGQEYYMEMKISHSLSDYHYFKPAAKLLSGGGSTKIKWQLHIDTTNKNTQAAMAADPYIPTVICFPFSDFALTLVMTCMATGEKHSSKMYINLGRLKMKIEASTKEMLKEKESEREKEKEKVNKTIKQQHNSNSKSKVSSSELSSEESYSSNFNDEEVVNIEEVVDKVNVVDNSNPNPKLDSHNKHTIIAQTEEIKCELRIFYTKEEKQKLIDEMNFKYPYDIGLPVPIVEIVSLEAQKPEEEDDGMEDSLFEGDAMLGKVLNEGDGEGDRKRNMDREGSEKDRNMVEWSSNKKESQWHCREEKMNDSRNSKNYQYNNDESDYDYDNYQQEKNYLPYRQHHQQAYQHQHYEQPTYHHQQQQYIDNTSSKSPSTNSPSKYQQNQQKNLINLNSSSYQNFNIHQHNYQQPQERFNEQPRQQQQNSTKSNSNNNNNNRSSYNPPNNNQNQKSRERGAIENNNLLVSNNSTTQNHNFEEIILSKQLSTFVQNNSQSRQFQSFLNEASPALIDLIIETLQPEFADLIQHIHANYMVQKLFSVCNYQQRLLIMELLSSKISGIVKNKQGTHCIQSLIKFFTSDEEYRLMCDSIDKEFIELSMDPNSTHFIQKIVDLFPLQHTVRFFCYAEKNFLGLALDKNGMCVIKHMFRLIADVEKKYGQQQGSSSSNIGSSGGSSGDKLLPPQPHHLTLPTHSSSPNPKEEESLSRTSTPTTTSTTSKESPILISSEAKKKFINLVTFCIDKIIQDSYGNYIVQFCYELFGEDKCTGITEMIIERFQQFCLQKYSSSVVYKCVASYWTRADTFARLKEALTPDTIIELFRNKDGNKVLIEVMERHENTPLREKIYNQLIMGEMTKFNHDRWGVVLGIRSGTVGTEWTSFSDAIGKSHQGGSSPSRKSSGGRGERIERERDRKINYKDSNNGGNGGNGGESYNNNNNYY